MRALRLARVNPTTNSAEKPPRMYPIANMITSAMERSFTSSDLFHRRYSTFVILSVDLYFFKVL